MKLANYCCIYLLLVFFMGGCLPVSRTVTSSEGKDFSIHEMTSNDFKAESARLNAITEKSKTAPNAKAEAHRRLAIIYLSPGNPKQDHKKALVELGKYLSLNPGELDKPAAASWATAIKSAKEFEQARQKLSRLEKKNSDLRKTAAKLEKTIEQLKNLDLSLEKKRKNLK